MKGGFATGDSLTDDDLPGRRENDPFSVPFTRQTVTANSRKVSVSGFPPDVPLDDAPGSGSIRTLWRAVPLARRLTSFHCLASSTTGGMPSYRGIHSAISRSIVSPPTLRLSRSAANAFPGVPNVGPG